jgi:hypothetical protein
MTADTRCPACGGQMPRRDRQRGGRPPSYCPAACKARAYRARQRSGEQPELTGSPRPATAAARHARVTETRQQISELTAILADTASGQQALFTPARNTRRTQPGDTGTELRRLVTELTMLATDATASAGRPAPRPAASAPQTPPLFGEPDTTPA